MLSHALAVSILYLYSFSHSMFNENNRLGIFWYMFENESSEYMMRQFDTKLEANQ